MAVFESGAKSTERKRFAPEELAERRRAQDRARHWRNREKRLMAQKARYRSGKKQAWKNPDGTWKTWGTPEQRKEIAKRSYQKNRDKRLAKEKAERAARRRVGDCPICFDSGVPLVWDHCHRSGQFRAFICSGCNLMLGHGRDNPTLLRAGADYLEAQKRKAG